MPHRSGVLLAAALALALTVGCTATDDGPSPSPSPTYQCTAPGSCTPQQAAKEQAAAKDHAAAEAALKAGLAETYRILRAGGSDKATPELSRTVAGTDLPSVVKALRDFKDDKRVGHGNVVVARVRFMTPYPKDSQEIFVCEDGTKWHTTDRQGKNPTKHGIYQTYTATMTRVDGQWKRTDTNNLTEVNSCDAS